MAESRIYYLGSLTLEQVGGRIEQFLATQESMAVDSVHGPGGYMIQARLQGQDWRKLLGWDKALRVQFLPAADGAVSVGVGEGKWLDKLGVGVVGALWFFPLAITSGIGVLGQLKLAKDVLDEVERYVMVAGGSAPADPEPEPPAEDPPAAD